jgi:hypothetical protein
MSSNAELIIVALAAEAGACLVVFLLLALFALVFGG